jgi:hypothetical protein
MSPAELGRRPGISEQEATVFLSAFIREGTVRTHLVELAEPATRPAASEPCTGAAAFRLR